MKEKICSICHKAVDLSDPVSIAIDNYRPKNLRHLKCVLERREYYRERSKILIRFRLQDKSLRNRLRKLENKSIKCL